MTQLTIELTVDYNLQESSHIGEVNVSSESEKNIMCDMHKWVAEASDDKSDQHPFN